MSTSALTRSYGNSIFSFLRSFLIIFHSGCTNLHSHQQGKMVPFRREAFRMARICNLRVIFSEKIEGTTEKVGKKVP